MSWIRVNRQNRCPVCNSDTWCEVSDDGAVALCMRVSSEFQKVFKTGEIGYIHRLTDAPRKSIPFKKEEPRPTIDVFAMMKEWSLKTKPEWLWQLAEGLGVKASALMELRVAWAAEHRAWAWPMRNGLGAFVGIRLRNNEGRKWAVTGSKSGIFLPFCIPQKAAWICEGPTDTAAALSLGLFAIGRPSCSGGTNEILAVIKRLEVRECVIIADNDAPGLVGAELLSKQLPIPNCIITMPGKDLRQSVNDGLTAEVLENMVKQTRWICNQT